MPGLDSFNAAMAQMSRMQRELLQVPSRASREVATGLTGLLQEEFATGTNPYGEPWQRLAESTVRRKGHAEILIDSHLAMNTTRAIPLPGAGVAVVTDQPALVYHQVGNSRLPKRNVFPDTRGLPASWDHVIEQAIDHMMERALS